MNLSKMQPNPGETILVHGGSSGVGSMAIKIAKLMGLKVIATVGDQSKLQRCLEIGADQVYSYQEGFADHLTKSVDMILDMLGGDYFTHNISCLKHNGRIAVIAVMQGSKAIAPLGTMLMRNISVFFSTLRSLDNTAKASLLAGFLQKFEHSMQTGALKPCIDSTFSFTSLPKAMERMKNRDHFGKIIIHPIS
jgi:NADPH:quinone reductase-like Zn-dependent oxidoreductase